MQRIKRDIATPGMSWCSTSGPSVCSTHSRIPPKVGWSVCGASPVRGRAVVLVAILLQYFSFILSQREDLRLDLESECAPYCEWLANMEGAPALSQWQAKP